MLALSYNASTGSVKGTMRCPRFSAGFEGAVSSNSKGRGRRTGKNQRKNEINLYPIKFPSNYQPR
jgi:hypothetical protein